VLEACVRGKLNVLISGGAAMVTDFGVARALSAAVRRELPALHRDRLIVEPSPRDTAPAIALAVAVIARHDPQATTMILPTDHVIDDAGAFERAVAAACRAAFSSRVPSASVKSAGSIQAATCSRKATQLAVERPGYGAVTAAPVAGTKAPKT